MNTGFLMFKEALSVQGLFSTDHIRLYFPGFNNDNLLNWQKKGYILKLRNKWYCFAEFPKTSDEHFLIANQIYSPSYISHQQALMFYGMIPEHIVNITSVTTKKTTGFSMLNRSFQYYSVKQDLFFGYSLMPVTLNGMKRSIMIAEKEKALLDLFYLYSFYKTEDDIRGLRLNETVMEETFDWSKMDDFCARFDSKVISKKVDLIKKIFKND